MGAEFIQYALAHGPVAVLNRRRRAALAADAFGRRQRWPVVVTDGPSRRPLSRAAALWFGAQPEGYDRRQRNQWENVSVSALCPENLDRNGTGCREPWHHRRKKGAWQRRWPIPQPEPINACTALWQRGRPPTHHSTAAMEALRVTASTSAAGPGDAQRRRGSPNFNPDHLDYHENFPTPYFDARPVCLARAARKTYRGDQYRRWPKGVIWSPSRGLGMRDVTLARRWRFETCPGPAF